MNAERLMIVFITAFLGVCMLILLATMWISYELDSITVRFSDVISKRDERLHKLDTRLQTLEEERDMEARITAIEKSLRIRCLDGVKEMCGNLGPVDRKW